MTLELAYKTSVHSSTGQTLAILEKGWNPRPSEEKLRKDLIDIHPTASSFKMMLDKVKHHEKQSMNDAFEYAKQKWDKSHKVPDFKVGNLALVLILNFNNIKGPKKPKYLYIGTFVIATLHGTNAVQVNSNPLTVPPVEQSEDKRIKKFIKERRHRGKNRREYLVRYRNQVNEDEWLAESEIPESEKLLRRFRHERKPQS
ncbi:hypothetical protein O181_016495 [Austropuccinia psidii MF-1]|uniref:Chromo domain-containing protein n=1 Tax=Austropuccinia psidii MF-1 TaxID=1389203 RepID=A0A9Q3C4Z3_9BASI|nr:hypothetical protein [Austropuccinia psidii MF-1]